MDLDTVEHWTTARTRADLAEVGERVAVVAGATWLFGAPQTHLEGLVDLTGLGWVPVAEDETGLEVAATCTIAGLDAYAAAAGWPAADLVHRCAGAFAASPKVLALATVGGNVAMALAAGPMTTLLVSLDATALVWGPDDTGGSDRRVPVEDLVTGPGVSALAPGEVLRSFHVPAATLRSKLVFRRISLALEGRSGAIVVGRRDDDGALLLTLTAGVSRPVRIGFGRLPSPPALTEALDDVDCWYDDHHGSASWREAMSRRFCAEVVAELRESR